MSTRISGFGSTAIICLITMALLSSFVSAQQSKFREESQSASENKYKFVDLLEAKDLSQFRGYQTETIGEGWDIEGKLLVFNGTGSGDLITKEEYDNFELRLEWSISEGGNSGIMFHVTLGDDQPYLSGPEFQILDDDKHSDGKAELTSAGALYGLYAPVGKKLRNVGGWNSCRFIVEGNKLTHFLNGVKVVEAEVGSEDWNKRLAASKFKDWEKFGKSPTGHIAFQNHGNAVKFRNVRVKRLEVETEGVASGATNKGKKNLMIQGEGSPIGGSPSAGSKPID